MAQRVRDQYVSVFEQPKPAAPKTPAWTALVGQTVFAAIMLVTAVYLGLPLLALLIQLAEAFWHPHSYRSYWYP